MVTKSKNGFLASGAYLTLAVIIVGLATTIFKWGVGWSDLHAQVKLKANVTEVTALKTEIREIKLALCYTNRKTCKFFSNIKP